MPIVAFVSTRRIMLAGQHGCLFRGRILRSHWRKRDSSISFNPILIISTLNHTFTFSNRNNSLDHTGNMRAYNVLIVLELLALAQAQTAIISESPLMTAGIIAPPAAGGSNQPPPPQGAMPAPLMPLATGPAPAAGDPIIDLKPLMTAAIIAGSMKLNEAAGIPQPDSAPAPSINSASLAVAGIVGGPAAQATAPPAMNSAGVPMAAAPTLPAGINPATLTTAGIIQGSNTTTNPTGGIQGAQPAAGNATIPAASVGTMNTGRFKAMVWVGYIMAGVFIVI
ncbi:hypothetical protein BKA64DRAFT_642655 [Cadophora sp. MPI-SDFR-AT-0126]|nr:hypothetical protein BKA64DRAFT_642655 [Leotiomycetes sp. MPI-SDFR-AT-0126]